MCMGVLNPQSTNMRDAAISISASGFDQDRTDAVYGQASHRGNTPLYNGVDGGRNQLQSRKQ